MSSLALARAEAILDEQALVSVIVELEARLPAGARCRQLSVRTLLVGVFLVLFSGQPAHLVRVHAALSALPCPERVRLGVVADWHGSPHALTYRQLSYLFELVVKRCGKSEPDGLCSTLLQELVDALLESSIPPEPKEVSSSLALDWTDVESFAHPPPKGGRAADSEASWGHRRGGGPGEKSELFFGYFLALSTMVREERGPEVPECCRGMTLSSCRHDPVPVQVRSLTGLVEGGRLRLSDVLCDSGYAHRVPEHFASPLRAAGARLVMDLHPSDRGPQGTYAGMILANGSCYCPKIPSELLGLGPLGRAATKEQVESHDARCLELSRYKFAPLAGPDADGYERISCPAAAGKLRCPLRGESMTLDYTRPEVFDPPPDPPSCCSQKSLTLPPAVNVKTRQRHDYPSSAWRRSYARRTAVERSNARIKDPATIDIQKGWCRVMGLAGPTLFIAIALCVRNLALIDAFSARKAEDERRRAEGREPKQRRRRRTSLAKLAQTSTGS